MRAVARALLIVAATRIAGAPLFEPVAQRGLQGPPDTRQFYICRVLPQYGGGFCTSPPYAPVGKRCSCEGPNGPRWGVVEHR